MDQRQRLADLLAVVRSINRAQQPFDDLYQWHFIIKKGREYRCNRLLSQNSDVAGHFLSVQSAFARDSDDEHYGERLGVRQRGAALVRALVAESGGVVARRRRSRGP